MVFIRKKGQNIATSLLVTYVVGSCMYDELTLCGGEELVAGRCMYDEAVRAGFGQVQINPRTPGKQNGSFDPGDPR